MKLKHLILSIMALGVLMVAFDSCTKAEEKELAKNEIAILSPQEKADLILNNVSQASLAFADGDREDSMILTEAQFTEICAMEDAHVNIWRDEDLRTVLPVGTRNNIPFEDKLLFLRQFIPASIRRVEDGGTTETYQVRNGNAWFDTNPDIIAQVIAASGTIVGTKSSLNLFRPAGDTGAVTYHDVARAMLGNIQNGIFDIALEYDPTSVVFEFQVSGGNWLIAADIIYTNPQTGQTETLQYGSSSPNGPLIWNPTLNSPVQDDVIEGPLPSGVLSLSANGLVPPAPID